MKLKSLLLGSAAAMMTVSGANAADAVFAAEPEPMEYVKVCDTYGNGFFYIPGTETCLSINGYARVEAIYLDNNIANPIALYNFGAALSGAGEYSGFAYRGRLNFDARNETDFGTLRSQIRIQGNGGPSADGAVALDRALISLGGIRFGYSDTFASTQHGYGWQRSDFGYAQYDQGVFLDYTFAANGFSATVGVEDVTSAGISLTGANKYDAYAGAAYSASFGRIAGSVHYDSSASEAAWKASAVITAIENLSIKGWYAGDNGGTSLIAYGAWEWGADVTYNVSSTLNVWAGYTDADIANAGHFGIGAHWNPVSGLSIRPEAHFGNDYTQLRLRVVRSF